MRGHYGNHYGRMTVGADPLTLGVGAVGTIALAFILLGPFIGTAATVAILRGDPSKDDRSKRGLSTPQRRKSISSPSRPSLPEPASEP